MFWLFVKECSQWNKIMMEYVVELKLQMCGWPFSVSISMTRMTLNKCNLSKIIIVDSLILTAWLI